MNILPSRPWQLGQAEITPEALWVDRRRLMAGLGLSAIGAAAAVPRQRAAASSSGRAADALTPFETVTSYNNYYEFGTGKADPARRGASLRTSPWTIQIGGMVHRPYTLDVDRLAAGPGLEERVYRLRCVEGWSMVIPWLGVPLAPILARAEPMGSGAHVLFTTLADRAQMPGLASRVLAWPYREALRLDEAMHPLTLLATGLYGRRLLPQNGAPARLVVPWKYGFKSGKSLVRIDVVERMPTTSWMAAAPSEYGYFANVNPNVDHPRWSQRRERRLGEILPRRTELFNGYGPEVAHLYRGMDLRRWF